VRNLRPIGLQKTCDAAELWADEAKDSIEVVLMAFSRKGGCLEHLLG